MTIDEILALPAYYRSSFTGSVRTGWNSLGDYIKFDITRSRFPLHMPSEEDADILRGYLMVLGIPAKVSTELTVGMITPQALGSNDDHR